MKKIELKINNKKHIFDKSVSGLEISKLLKVKSPIFVTLNKIPLPLATEIKDSGDLIFESDENNPIVWSEINKIAATYLFNFLEKSNIAKNLISIDVNEDGFILKCEVTKNLSTKQFPLFEGKTLKSFSRSSNEFLINSNLIKFIKLRDISGATHNENKTTNIMFGFVSITKEQ